MFGRDRYSFSSRHFQSSFRGWAYQDFTAGTITTTSVTISANENGTDLYGFDSNNIVNSTAVIVIKATPSRKAYTGTTRLFSTKVETSTHTGTSITLSGIPHSSWGDIRVYYFYDYPLGMPQGYQIPSKAVAENLFAELQSLMITEEELGDGSKDVVFNSIENTPIGASTPSTGDFTDISFSGGLSGTVNHTTLTNIGTNSHGDIDTHIALTNEHIDWMGAADALLTTDSGTFSKVLVGDGAQAAPSVAFDSYTDAGMYVVDFHGTPDICFSIDGAQRFKIRGDTFYFADTDSDQFANLRFTGTAMTADRVLSIDMNNASRTLDLLADMTFDQDELDTAGSPTFVKPTIDELLFDFDTQDYLFTNRGETVLALQSQTDDTTFALDLYTKKGDGGDALYLNMFAKGLPSDVTNYEAVSLAYNPSGPNFALYTSEDGTGTLLPLYFYTGANTTQFILGTDGNNTMGGDLGVTGAITGAGLTIPTTGEINFRDTDISIGSTLTDGILDISADGSIRMFYDNADVGDETDGQKFYVYRRAAEGDRYFEMYINKDKGGVINASSDWSLKIAGSSKLAFVSSLMTAYVNLRMRYDNTKLVFGGGSDASIYYNNTHLVIDPAEVGSGTVIINNLPSADPSVAGGLWNNSGVLNVSAG